MHENTLSNVALNQALNTTSTLEEFTQYLPLSNERPHAIQANSIQALGSKLSECSCFAWRHSNKSLIKIGLMWKINYCHYVKVQISLNYMTKALKLTTFRTISSKVI